jgi:cytidylate kinase
VFVGYDTKTVNPENLAEKVRETGVNSKVSEVLTLEQFRQRTDNKLGQHATSGSGCCGGKGGHDQTTQTKHPD